MTEQDNTKMNAWLRGQVERNNQAGRPVTVGGAPTPAPVAVEAAPAAPPRSNAGAGTGAPPAMTPPDATQAVNDALRALKYGRRPPEIWRVTNG